MTKFRFGIFAVFGLLFIPVAIADDGSGCGYMSGGLWAAECYLPNIYHQNQILIQEQNQTNHLLAMAFCEGGSSYQMFPVDKYYNGDQLGANQNDYWNCVNKVLGDTK